jgi:hypothetical protein
MEVDPLILEVFGDWHDDRLVDSVLGAVQRSDVIQVLDVPKVLPETSAKLQDTVPGLESKATGY